ncbi:MAG TPA: hypothetical protein VJZ27_17970 [Aggregatilineales bacterium]|nr:hypothetical protein [Aggregatilineales bacterium]
MMRKWFILMLILTIGLAACGGNNDEEEAATSVPTSTPQVVD